MSEMMTDEPHVVSDGLDPQLVAKVVAILYDVLDFEPTGLDDELPDIADKSITTINLLVAISDDLRADVPLDALMRVRTVRDLADLVAAHRPRRRVRS